jgi:DNA-binding MarR family transcriptional regulator
MSNASTKGKGEARPRGASSTAFLLTQVGAHAAMRFAERLAPLKLAPPHAGILRALSREEGMSQQALCGLLSMMPSRLVVLLDELEERKLVERRDDPGDRRSYALYLTKAGRAALDSLGRIAREHNDAICAGLDAEERRQLTELLERIVERQGLIEGIHPGFSSLGRRGRKRGE